MNNKRAARRRFKMPANLHRVRITGSDCLINLLIGYSEELLLRPSELVALLLSPEPERNQRIQWIRSALKHAHAARLHQVNKDQPS